MSSDRVWEILLGHGNNHPSLYLWSRVNSGRKFFTIKGDSFKENCPRCGLCCRQRATPSSCSSLRALTYTTDDVLRVTKGKPAHFVYGAGWTPHLLFRARLPASHWHQAVCHLPVTLGGSGERQPYEMLETSARCWQLKMPPAGCRAEG